MLQSGFEGQEGFARYKLPKYHKDKRAFQRKIPEKSDSKSHLQIVSNGTCRCRITWNFTPSVGHCERNCSKVSKKNGKVAWSCYRLWVIQSYIEKPMYLTILLKVAQPKKLFNKLEQTEQELYITINFLFTFFLWEIFSTGVQNIALTLSRYIANVWAVQSRLKNGIEDRERSGASSLTLKNKGCSWKS